MIKTINLKTELSEAYSKNFNLIHSSFIAMNTPQGDVFPTKHSRNRPQILLASVFNSVACFYTTGLLSLARGLFWLINEKSTQISA